MRKISTLFKKDPNDLGRVINEVTPENQWVMDGEGHATQKFDGTACAIIAGKFYKRYDVKKGRKVPDGAIPCQEPGPITGHWPHWIQVGDGPEDIHLREAFANKNDSQDGTYEAVGPKIQGNPEHLDRHSLFNHNTVNISGVPRTWDGIRSYLEYPANDVEGIVYHHPDGRMCKIRKSDFGFKRSSQ